MKRRMQTFELVLGVFLFVIASGFPSGANTNLANPDNGANRIPAWLSPGNGVAVSVISPQQQNSDSPSLAETLKFIQDKLVDYGTTYCCDDANDYVKNVSDMKFSGCEATETSKRYFFNPKTPADDMVDKFNLGDLDSSGITAFAWPGNGKEVWMVALPIANGEKKMIHTITIYTDSTRTTVKSSGTVDKNRTSLQVRGQEMAERLAHALQHAVTLCAKSKKTDPF